MMRRSLTIFHKAHPDKSRKMIQDPAPFINEKYDHIIRVGENRQVSHLHGERNLDSQGKVV